MLKQVVLLLALVCACGDSSVEEGETAQSVAGSGGSGSGTQHSGDECDPTPIDAKGTLPACVAGRSNSRGPGRLANAIILPEPPASPEAVTSTERATQTMKVRNPASQDPLDRGFAPPPKAGAQ